MLRIHKGFFTSREEVLEDIKQTGFWPTTYVSGPAPEPDVHWHTEEVHAYVMEGRASFLDARSGTRHPVEFGDKIVVPPRTLHAEGKVDDSITYIVALPEALPPDRFLIQRSPDDL